MSLTPYGRFVLLIDGAGFYHTLRDLRLQIDYRKFLAYWRTCGTLVRAHYFTALLDAPLTPDWLLRLLDWLAYNGYQVHTKRAQRFEQVMWNEEGEQIYVSEVKGGVEMEMTVLAMRAYRYCDTILLCSGSGELVPMVRAVQRHGCRVIVVSSDVTQEGSVASELLRQADEFIELDTLRQAIALPPRD